MLLSVLFPLKFYFFLHFLSKPIAGIVSTAHAPFQPRDIIKKIKANFLFEEVKEIPGGGLFSKRPKFFVNGPFFLRVFYLLIK